MNSTFCALAFNHVSCLQDGSARLCCNTRDTINDDNNIPYNLGFHDVEEIINSNHYKQIRQDMIAGKEIPACASCTFQSRLGSQTPRDIYNQSFTISNPVPTIDIRDIKYLDVRFGNLCNLKCLSCAPHSSTQIDKETREIALVNPDILKFHEILNDDVNSWYQTDTFNFNLNKIMSNLTLIYLTGGEPTLIEENYNFMQKLIDYGLSKNITLKFSTNLTNIQQRFLDIIKDFKEVSILGSIDGIGEVQEYLRYPSHWPSMDKNIKNLLQVPNVSLIITPLIQNANLEFLTELFDYVDDISKQFSKKIKIYPQILHGPAHLNVMALPLEYKLYCWKKLEKAMPKYNKELHFLEKIEQIKNLCTTESDYLPELLKFKKYVSMYDAHRKNSLMKANPRLYEIIQKV